MTDKPRRSIYPPPMPADTTGAKVATHDHRLPRGPFVILGTALVLLFVSTALTFAYGLSVQHRLHALETDYQALKIQRNQQLSDLDMRINQGMCDLLDTLPVTPLLDEARDKYGCGPGLPYEQLSPEAQRELGNLQNPPEPTLLRPDELERADRTRDRLTSIGEPIAPAQPPGS